MSNNIIDSIQLSGTVYTIQGTGGGGSPTVELTQAEYDALVSAGTVSANTYYIITDAQEGDLTQYWTSAQTNSAINAAVSGKQDTLSAGTGIDITDNVISATGGGGTTYTAGRGIDITNDTISVSLPISAGTGSNSIIENSPYNKATGNYTHAEGHSTSATNVYSHAEGYQTLASGQYAHAEGHSTSATNVYSHAEGYQTLASGQYAHAEGHSTTAQTYCHSEGYKTNANAYYSHAEGYQTLASGSASHTEGGNTSTFNPYEHASGQYNVSSLASTTFGDSGNTLFSVGNGTANNARHNAFEIRQNGDIYLTSGGTDIKLQDHLGGGGGGTVDQTIISGDTNAVAGGAVYDAVVYSANTYTTELTFDANGYAENWIVGQSAITIDVSGYTSDAMADYRFEDSNGNLLGDANIYKTITSWDSQWHNYAAECTITTDGDTATTAIITDIPSGTVKIRRIMASNPPKAIISGDTPETWIKDALDDHRDNTTVHITAQERSTWNNKSNFSGSYNDLTDKPIPDSALTSNSTNAVQSKTLYDELRVSGSGQVSDVTVEFDSQGDSTNFPSNCTTVKVEVSGSDNYATIHFRSGLNEVGLIVVNNYGSITVYSEFADSSYEISGNTAIITYPLSKQIDGLNVDNDSAPYTIKATPGVSYTPLKDVVAENTTALGGLKLVKLSQSDYNALTTKDDNTVYFIGDSTNGYTMKIGSANVN